MAERDAAWIEREYGTDKWPVFVRLIEEETAAAADGDSASRIFGRVLRRWRYLHAADSLRREQWLFDNRSVHVPLSVAYGAYSQLIVDAVLDACTERTQLVLELGCGPGHNLMNLWLQGGPRRVQYVGAEYTAAGRRAVDLLAALDPELSLHALAFDYHAPDLSTLSGFEHAVVFSAHSIEQIPYVPAALFDEIRGVATSVTALHFEPLGWQTGAGEGSSRAYAEQHDYNRNFVELLRDEERVGRLSIERLEPGVIGEAANSSTLVEWHSLKTPE